MEEHEMDADSDMVDDRYMDMGKQGHGQPLNWEQEYRLGQ